MLPISKMKKIDIEKNVLDLSYGHYLQFLNILLILGGGALLAYLAGFVLSPEKRFQYSLLFSVIGLLVYILYAHFDERLKEISRKIKNLV